MWSSWGHLARERKSVSYYDRKSTDFNGRLIFKSDDDEKNESEVARAIEDRWNVAVHSFGRIAPLDFWIARDGAPVAFAEVKARSHSHDRHTTVFLNVRKWLAMQMAAVGCDVAVLFFVRFTDRILYIKVDDIDASQMKVGGCSRIVKSCNDIEPVIEIPIANMAFLAATGETEQQHGEISQD